MLGGFNTKLYNYLPDKILRRDTILMITVVMTSAVLENLTLNLTYSRELTPYVPPDEADKTTLEFYFRRANYRLYELFGYNAGLAVYAFFLHKLQLFSWNFLDIAIAVFARSMYYRFSRLNRFCFDQLMGLRTTHNENRILGSYNYIFSLI